MTDLAVPDVCLQASWAEAILEFGSETIHGSGIGPDAVDVSNEGCAAFVDELRRAGDVREPPLRPGWVHCTHFWIVDGPDLVGFLALRHELTPFLLEEGGHIGYSVRPSRRREGHASRALALALPRAAALGLDRVLLTCDEDNVASRRTIEQNGGELEDIRSGRRRYWIATPAAGQASGR